MPVIYELPDGAELAARILTQSGQVGLSEASIREADNAPPSCPSLSVQREFTNKEVLTAFLRASYLSDHTKANYAASIGDTISYFREGERETPVRKRKNAAVLGLRAPHQSQPLRPLPTSPMNDATGSRLQSRSLHRPQVRSLTRPRLERRAARGAPTRLIDQRRTNRTSPAEPRPRQLAQT